jgi:hypothetical protein
MTHAMQISPVVATFLTAIDRVEVILEQEHSALGALPGEALKELSDRKVRSLLEISRAARGLSREDGPQVEARLETLRSKLDRSQAALLLHLNAAREIAALVARAIEEAESDGTYSASLARRSNR